MDTKSRKDWNAGLIVDGIANAAVIGAGVVVVLLAVTSAGLESAAPEGTAHQERAGDQPRTTAPA